jgi:hypothetical protein
MAEELGKIEKPAVEKFSKGRKLFFVPLIFSPPETESDFTERIRKYWDEVETQLSNLEAKLGGVKKIFHEMVPEGGEQGAEVIRELNSYGYRIVKSRQEKGAEIRPVEDIELLTEFMDWSKCLSGGLQNRKVLTRVYESYSEVISKRNEDISKKLNELLKDDEIGLLLMREGHHVRFPSDMDVFYVSPPALDEIKRWIRAREEEMQAELTKTAVQPKESKEPEAPAKPVEKKEPKKSKKANKPKNPKDSSDTGV